MTEYLIAVICALIFCIGILVGAISVSISWEDDCLKLGAHISRGKVYDCKERK